MFLLAQPSRFMAKSIDLSIGQMQQRQPIDRQVITPDDLQSARVNTFRDRLCARFHRQWHFRKEVTYTAHRLAICALTSRRSVARIFQHW